MDKQQDVETIRRARYVNFVTFRKNGERKSTPIWIAVDGGHAIVWTNRDTWKVKRLHNNPECEMIPSNVTGTRNIGETVRGRAIDLDMQDLKRAKKAFRKKYPGTFSLLEFMGRLRPGSDHVYIEIEILGDAG